MVDLLDILLDSCSAKAIRKAIVTSIEYHAHKIVR